MQSTPAPPSSMLISLHLPKTAGTSFADELRANFGGDLWLDYADMPMQVPRPQREWSAIRQGWRLRHSLPQTVRCVHGHFLAIKYALACSRRNASFVTWLREPVQRMVSHYHFWRRDFVPDAAEPLRRRVVEEDWSLERFCLGPELRNLYARYLWGVGIRRFGFIGITEHYAEDLPAFSARYFNGIPSGLAMANVNPERSQDGYIVEPTLRRRIEEHHAHDVALYNWALGERVRRTTRSLRDQ